MPEFKPGQPVPELQVETLEGISWRLQDREPPSFTLIVFYRGLHCPICKGYIGELDGMVEDFKKRGVDVIAIGTDDLARARKSAERWGLKNLNIGYGLSIDKAREWRLYISKSIKDPEPEQFAEPGLFLIRPDRTLYAASIQSMPFARPPFDDVLKAIDFIQENDYPPRGEA